ncbi:tRNA lysidine(34) synthetase TilS [Desulfonatronovibrio magnus]|uniref:tRNA lysidine(34) synthetase TilS n=1 Tax=Desulfonatronovibrio magnus TaxID=698827 RepID=UPI0005EBE8A8|nr:tRNA lysidine(34) synthetase TilS [Desulfonatronovibrio magnus]
MLDTLQTLPGKWARFCLRIESFWQEVCDLEADYEDSRTAGKIICSSSKCSAAGITKHAGKVKESRVLIALSGGPDSVALLKVLFYLRIRNNLDIHAAHLNHMLRPEADQEEDFVSNCCREHDILLVRAREDVQAFAAGNRMGIEEAARFIRYEFLAQEASRLDADFIMTGHHLNDLAEDQLLRLGRGTGWPGLAGMKAYDPSRRLMRILLRTPKQDILDFLKAVRQNYITDYSNDDTSFSRNRVRHNIVPEMEQINPGYLDAVESMWQLGRIDERHWQDILENIPVHKKGDDFFCAPDTLQTLSCSVRLRLYKNVLDRLGPGQALFDSLITLDRLWLQKAGNKMVQFPGDKFAKIYQKGVLFGIISR